MKTWNQLTSEEKNLNIRQLDETYNFSDYEDAEAAAYDVRIGYENDPAWFGFEVEDLDKFEKDLKDIIESRYFTLKCYIDMESLYRETESVAWDGWFCPVWASIENGEIELSLGAPVSKGTTFVDNDGKISSSWVGDIPCWERYYGEDDAEQWAEDNDCDPEEFDSDEAMEIEIENWDLSDEENTIRENIREFAKSEGYKVIF